MPIDFPVTAGKFKHLAIELVGLNMNLFWEEEILLSLNIVLSSLLFTWEVPFQVRLLFSEEARTVSC